jgi:hypothetical protein
VSNTALADRETHCTRSWRAFRAGNEDICSVLAGYAVLLPGVFDQPFITFLEEWKTMVDVVLLFRLSTQMVELFGLYADQLLTEATLLVGDREPFAGALFEMICAKLCTASCFFQPCENGKLPDPE